MERAILICAICFLIGIMFDEMLRHLQKAYGTLRIDHSNPEKDVYRIDLDYLDDLSNKKFIILKIDNDADLSQE